MDLEAFSISPFEVKHWINQACLARPPAESLDRHLAELEMRLLLTAEEVQTSLQEQSRDAQYRIPAAVQEIAHVKGDLLSLKQSIHRQLQLLGVAATASSNSVALLKDIDQVKGRLEDACSTLKEATQLSQLFQSIEAAFASQDLPCISDMLNTMRRSLKLVGNVPEFHGGMERLQGLEERFLGLIEPKLAAALSQKNGQRVQQLSGMLLGMQSTSTVEKLYNTARMAPLQAAWDGYDRGAAREAGGPAAPQDFPSWLPDFFEVILAAAASELRWCASVLPELHPQLVLHLLAALFTKISKSFRSRLMSACAAGMQQHGQVLSVLVELKGSAERFTQELRQSLSGLDVAELQPIAMAVFSPFESQISRYGELQQPLLNSDIDAIQFPDVQAEEMDTVLPALQHTVSQAMQAVQKAQSWCAQVTSGSDMATLLRLSDAALVQYIVQLQSASLALRRRVLGANGQGSVEPRRLTHELSDLASASSTRLEAGAEVDTDQDPTSIVALLNVAGALSSQLASLESSLHTASLDLQTLIDQATAHDHSQALTMAVVRLQQPEALQQLQSFMQQASASGWRPLPVAAQRAAGFAQDVQSLIYDVLLDKVKAQLGGMHSLPVWASQEADSGMSLPSFSAYPQLRVTAAGEYLMLMPQMLEGLLAESAEGADTEWLDKVAAGAAQLYAEEMMQIPRLTQHGSQQLLADLEYFGNVLAALGVPIPASITTWQVALAWSEEDFISAAQAALDGGLVEAGSLQTYARARGLAAKTS